MMNTSSNSSFPNLKKFLAKVLLNLQGRLLDEPESKDAQPSKDEPQKSNPTEDGPVYNLKELSPEKARDLESRQALQRKNKNLLRKNQELSDELSKASQKMKEANETIKQLTQPPNSYGTVISVNEETGSDEGDTKWSADIISGARKLRVLINPDLVKNDLPAPGAEVLLNSETMSIVAVATPESIGEVVSLKELVDDNRALVVGRGDEEKVFDISENLKAQPLRPGDSLLANTKSNILLERLPRPEVEELILEEIPDVTYENVAGLDPQIEMIKDAVELPFLNSELFGEHALDAPKGILLYGPPGCGKTLIAKAVANSLENQISKDKTDKTRSYFFNIKGPELLNKYVGETERQIRTIFQRAREKSEVGGPVIVFFDEMESLFRMRGSGISSDVESTIVPQLLAEIDGLEALRNVIVIGASNREDLIDPAILRPGRLDVKIKIERPDSEAALSIFNCYLTPDLPIAPEEIETNGGGDKDKAIQYMIEQTVASMYAQEEQNQFLEVTYLNGDKEVMYFKDFASGAMIENIVRRAKKYAIKRHLDGEEKGICLQDFSLAVVQEFKEHEDLPNTTNPDDWARISGKKGERIRFVRTLIQADNKEPFGGKSIEQVGTGQYL